MIGSHFALRRLFIPCLLAAGMTAHGQVFTVEIPFVWHGMVGCGQREIDHNLEPILAHHGEVLRARHSARGQAFVELKIIPDTGQRAHHCKSSLVSQGDDAEGRQAERR